MNECHYNDLEIWAPCELDGVKCKNCAYYWDDDEYEQTEEEDAE